MCALRLLEGWEWRRDMISLMASYSISWGREDRKVEYSVGRRWEWDVSSFGEEEVEVEVSSSAWNMSTVG